MTSRTTITLRSSLPINDPNTPTKKGSQLPSNSNNQIFFFCTPPLSSFSKRRIMVGCVIDVMIKVIMMMMINILQEK